MSKIYKKYSSSTSSPTTPSLSQSTEHKDKEEKQNHNISHFLSCPMEEDESNLVRIQHLLLPKHNLRHTTTQHADKIIHGDEHPNKRRKHIHHTPDSLYDVKARSHEYIHEDEEEEENEDEEEEEEDAGEHQKQRKRKGGGGRKSKNIPQCTRCNERAAWKHDKKGKRWFCKHCKLPFTPGVVPLNKPKREIGDMNACTRCGNTVSWRHDKSRRKCFCKKCSRPVRPDEAESDEDFMGYTSSDSRDRENIDHRDKEVDRGMGRREHGRSSSFTPSPDNDVDERESFLVYGASKILMALKNDRLFELLGKIVDNNDS